MLAAPHQQSYRPRQRPVRTYCGQLGHVIQKYFKIHGYPPGYKGPNNTHKGHQNQQSQGFSPRGQKGQQSQAPRYPGAYTQHPNANAPAYLQSNTVANVTGAPTLPLDLNMLNPDQVQSLLQHLQRQVRSSEHVVRIQQASVTEGGYTTPQSTSGIILSFSSNLRYEDQTLTYHHQCLSSLYNTLPRGSWIFNSGATMHVCYDIACFTDLSPVNGVIVSLSNGFKEHITHIGIIHISSSIVLHNVLYVPSFHFNLISINCLIRDNNCSAHFYLDHCLVQESTRGLTIGRGNIFSNLYILDASFTTFNVCGSLSVDGHMWYQLLGHPSALKLQCILGILPLSKSSESDIDHCRVCLLAKQKRLPFTSHNHLSSSPSDLVHMDV